MTTSRFCEASSPSQRLIATAGEVIVGLTVLVILCNMVDAALAKPAFYRVTISTLCFAVALIATVIRPRYGIALCVFLAPLLPNVTFQIQAFLGYGRIFPAESAGFDLAAGLFLGAIAHRLLRRPAPGVARGAVIDLPWQAGAVILFVTFSVALAISRNLSQTLSPFNFAALGQNLLHFREIGWHDDFRPLADWVAYGAAFAFMAIMVPALRVMPDRNDVVFKPLVWGVLLAAAIGCAQSATGMGLRPHQLPFRSDHLGYTALGFQPDIHAFAGHMLLGVCGLLGYWYQTPSRVMRLVIPLVAIPLASVALVLSKSKSSVALAVLLLATLVLVWALRNAPRARRLLAWTALAVLIATGASFYALHDTWMAWLTSLAQSRGYADLEAVNFEVARRPEIFMAGLRMFSQFPLLGLGQGEFYRSSADFAFSASPFLSHTLNGENAHNYFLQILVENGLIGFALFLFMLVSPLRRTRDWTVLVPVLTAMASVFLANIYAHSLLVRDNLLVAATLVSLLYAWAAVAGGPQSVQPTTGPACESRLRYAGATLAVLALRLVAAAAYEVKTSFRQAHFTTDVQCQVWRAQTADGWTAGLYQEPLPLGAHGFSFVVDALPPDIGAQPLRIEAQISHATRGLLATQEITISEPGKPRIAVTLPGGALVDDDDYRAVLRLQRCFIPRNLGINGDGRRLGVRIKSIEIN